MRLNSLSGLATGAAVFAAVSVTAWGAQAQGTVQATPLGVWLDHTGRGAVEITECGKGVCGHVVWIKDSKNAQGCGVKILSDVKPIGGNKWDNGKIFDPDQNSTFDVELTPIGADKLKVMGYAGVKFLSQTFTWKRAPADLKRCNDQGSATSPAAPPPAQKAEVPKTPEPPAAPADTSNGASMTAGTGTTTAKPAAPGEDPVVPAVREPKVAAAPAPPPPEDTTEKAPEPDEDAKPEPRRKGGKKQCKFRVPFGDMVVYYPCEK